MDSAGTTSMSWPAVTTTKDCVLMVLAAAMDTDASSTSTFYTDSTSNPFLQNLTEIHDQTTSSGVGGGLAIVNGELRPNLD